MPKAQRPPTTFNIATTLDGNVILKKNAVNPDFTELYTYDSLNRLTTFQRGSIVNNSFVDNVYTPNSSQSWNLDAVGNQIRQSQPATRQVTRSRQQPK